MIEVRVDSLRSLLYYYCCYHYRYCIDTRNTAFRLFITFGIQGPILSFRVANNAYVGKRAESSAGCLN